MQRHSSDTFPVGIAAEFRHGPHGRSPGRAARNEGKQPQVPPSARRATCHPAARAASRPPGTDIQAANSRRSQGFNAKREREEEEKVLSRQAGWLTELSVTLPM